MSDMFASQLRRTQRRIGQTEVGERPALYLPWSQRVLNPFPLASSGGTWGDLPLPWPTTIQAATASVYVLTTNNGTNYWTITLVAYPSGTTLASMSTAAIAANTGTRLEDTTITQPATTDTWMELRATATGSPGAIYIFPSVAMLRSG